MSRLLSTLVFVLCSASLATAQITWTAPTAAAFVKPEPQFYAFTITSSVNYLPSELFLNYTIGSPCAQPVIPPQGCGSCSAGTPNGADFDFSCNCSTIDLSTVTTAADRCQLSISVYENRTSTASVTNSVGFLYAGTPQVAALSVVGGSTWINPVSSTEAFIRFTGTDLGNVDSPPSIDVELVQMDLATPCSPSTATLTNVTVVSSTEVIASIGAPNSFVSSVDGCLLRVTSFNRQPAPGVTGVVSSANTLLIARQPVIFVSGSGGITTEELNVNVAIDGAYLPRVADQATDRVTFSFSGSAQCTSLTITQVSLASEISSNYAGTVSVSGTPNNCQMFAVFRRFGFAFPAVNIGTVADVFLSNVVQPSVISASAGRWTLVFPTLRDLNPNSNPYFFSWTFNEPGCQATVIPSGNETFTGCLSTTFGAASVTCTIAVNPNVDGCVLEGLFARGTPSNRISANPIQIGLLAAAPLRVAPSPAINYYSRDSASASFTIDIGQAGVGGSVASISGVNIDVLGTGCSGGATGTLAQFCNTVNTYTRLGNGLTTISCTFTLNQIGGLSIADVDTVCDVVLTLSNPAYGSFNTTFGKMVAVSPSVSSPTFDTNGFTGNGILLQIQGSALPLASDGYGIVVTSNPANCFTPLPIVASGRCVSGGPSSIDRSAFDCLINGTFTNDDPCILSFIVRRFNSSNVASTPLEVATRLIAIPSIATSGSAVRPVVPGGPSSVSFEVTGLPQTPPTQTTVTAFCGAASTSCIVSSEGAVNSTHTSITCDVTFVGAGFDTCLVEFAVARFGLLGPRVPLFRIYYIPTVSSGTGFVAPSDFIDLNITLRGSNFPRTDEQAGAAITFDCNTPTTVTCSSVRIVTSGTSLVCTLNVPVVSNNCPVRATVSRFGGTSSAVQIGFVSTDTFVLGQSPLVGYDLLRRPPYILPLKGYNWNVLAGRAVNLRYLNTCYGSGSGTVYATCDPTSTSDASTLFCNITNSIFFDATNVTTRLGCPVRVQVGAATLSFQPIYFRMVTTPVINPSNVVVVASSPTTIDISGQYLPPTTTVIDITGSTENVVITLSSVKLGCDMSQVTIQSITQVDQTFLQATINPPASLNDCPFNLTLTRHGFSSNTVSFGKIGARSEIASPTAQRGIPIGDSVLSIPLLYPPGAGESVAVDFQFAVCSATPPTCISPRMVGDSVVCNITVPADAHNCVLRASINRNNFGAGAVGNVGVTIRRPVATAASGTVRAITPTQVVINGNDLPAESDVRAITFQASGSNCVGAVTCGTPVFAAPNSITCTVNVPLTLRGCTVSATVSRFAIASAPADLFTVIDPVYSPMNVSFLFEGDAIPVEETYTNISRGFAESLQVVGGVSTVPFTSSKRGVATVYGAISTFSTYDAVAGANQLRTDATLRTLLINSIFLYTRQAFNGIPDSFQFDGARAPLTAPAPVAPPSSVTPTPSSLAPQGGSAVSGGLDAGGIAAIAVVVSIVAIVAIVIVVLVATGRIGGPVPKPPPKQDKSAKMGAPPAAGTAASGGAEESSSSEEGSSSGSGSGSGGPAPETVAAPVAPPAAEPAENPADSETSSESDGSESEGSSGEEESSAEEESSSE